MSDWKEYRFSDFVEMNPSVKLRSGEEYSFVEMKDLSESNKFARPSAKRILSGGARFEEGDTLFARITPCLENGKICQVKDLDNGIGFGSTEFLVFRGKNDISTNEFVFYLSRSDEVRKFGEKNMSGTSGRQRVNREAFNNLYLKVPPIEEQKAIAKILSGFDEKIEVNRRMNATLEEMARALFKAWFVDFEPVHANRENRPSTSASPEIAKLFPSTFENDIPKGWQFIKLEEIVETISVTHKFPNDQIVFLNTSDISNGFVLTHKYSDVEGLPGQAKKSIKKHDILYSEIRPANKRFAYIDFEADDYVVSTKLMVLRTKSFVDPVFIYYFLKSDETIAHLQMLAESRSGTFPQITFDQLKRLEILVPNSALLELYTDYLKGIFRKTNLNVRQNDKLAEIRDSLLPRLISGKISVGKPEKVDFAA